MKRRAIISCAIWFVLCSQLCNAKETHAPLPSAVLTAKTIYVDNQSGVAVMGDRAYDELRKWGRFEIVDNPQKADMVLLLSVTSYDAGYVLNGTGQTVGANDGSTNSQVYSEGEARHVEIPDAHVTLIDPKTGTRLWSDVRRAGVYKSATRELVKELRDRISEQEKAAKKK